jgi:hypothetical protein
LSRNDGDLLNKKKNKIGGNKKNTLTIHHWQSGSSGREPACKYEALSSIPQAIKQKTINNSLYDLYIFSEKHVARTSIH